MKAPGGAGVAEPGVSEEKILFRAAAGQRIAQRSALDKMLFCSLWASDITFLILSRLIVGRLPV